MPYINMNQPYVQECPLPFDPPSHLPPYPTPLGCHTAWVVCIFLNYGFSTGICSGERLLDHMLVLFLVP